MTPKKDYTLLFWVNFRLLIQIIIPWNYPIPMIHDFLDILGDSDIFRTLYFNIAYFKITISVYYVYNTTLPLHMVVYQVKLIIIGLLNILATFQLVFISN